MKVECTFTDECRRLGVTQKIKRVIEIKNVGRNRLERTVITQARKQFPMMDVHSFEVIK